MEHQQGQHREADEGEQQREEALLEREAAAGEQAEADPVEEASVGGDEDGATDEQLGHDSRPEEAGDGRQVFGFFEENGDAESTHERGQSEEDLVGERELEIHVVAEMAGDVDDGVERREEVVHGRHRDQNHVGGGLGRRLSECENHEREGSEGQSTDHSQEHFQHRSN